MQTISKVDADDEIEDGRTDNAAAIMTTKGAINSDVEELMSDDERNQIVHTNDGNNNTGDDVLNIAQPQTMELITIKEDD